MSKAAEAIAPGVKQFNRQLLIVAALWVLMMVSGLGVIYTTHITRQQFNELESLRRTSAQLHEEWGQYLLERSTWASYNRIADAADNELQMSLPQQDKIVVIQKP